MGHMNIDRISESMGSVILSIVRSLIVLTAKDKPRVSQYNY